MKAPRVDDENVADVNRWGMKPRLFDGSQGTCGFVLFAEIGERAVITIDLQTMIVAVRRIIELVDETQGVGYVIRRQEDPSVEGVFECKQLGVHMPARGKRVVGVNVEIIQVVQRFSGLFFDRAFDLCKGGNIERIDQCVARYGPFPGIGVSCKPA